MTVGVNARFLMQPLEGYGYYCNEILSRITRAHADHRFIFFFDRPFDDRFIFSNNISPVVLNPPARHPFLWKYWYDIQVSFALKKYNCDIFYSPDGFCSLSSSIPQCMVIHDLAFLHHPEFIPASHRFFYRRYTGKFIRKAKQIITVSEFAANDIGKHYPVVEEKIKVIYNGAREIFKPLDFTDREKIRSEISGEMQYFMYFGAIHPRKNLVNLLKAFSIFKKWQRTGMKLLLAGRLAWKNDTFLSLLRNYKYRDDVLVRGYLDEQSLANAVASSYAIIYPSLHEGFGMPVIEAMRAGVPVITSAGTAMQEVAGDAALFFNPDDPQSIADQMMALYKNELLRDQFIERGLDREKNFNWDKAAEQTWQILGKTAGSR